MSGERLALSDVINELWPIRAKFYNLGLNLGIDEGTLDTFKKKDIDDAFSDVIKTWLRRSPESSWKIIIEALRRPSLNEEALANEIAKLHCPSELVLFNTGTENKEEVGAAGNKALIGTENNEGVGAAGNKALIGWQNSSNWIFVILAAVVLCVSVIVMRGSSNGKVTFNGDSSTLMEGRPNNIVSLRNFPHMHERPSMIQLSMLERGAGGGKPVRIIERIGSKNAELGHFLLNDEDGSIMETIVDNTRGNNEAVNREMFRRWLAGSGVQPVTWKKLVEALERFKLKELANDIVDALHT